MKVRVIEPTINIIPKRLRVAAYVRVSVEKELTEHSFVAQLDHCSKIIKARPDWVNAGVYSDYGITGTKLDRPGFKALMEACNAGKIDLILAKSISRFCRNTVDLLNTIRVLRDKGINVHFERENMDTISDSGELLLSLLASYAQEESRSMSENCKWAIRKKFEQGIGNWFHLYGYRWDGKQFQIIDNEAEVIRRIFKLYTEGVGPHAIAKDLRTHGYVRRDGTPFTYSRIVKILNQEKYCGNSLLQKTFRENHITKRRTVNNGEYPMYFIEESHPAIINPKMYEKVKVVNRTTKQVALPDSPVLPERLSALIAVIHLYEQARKRSGQGISGNAVQKRATEPKHVKLRTCMKNFLKWLSVLCLTPRFLTHPFLRSLWTMLLSNPPTP